MILHCCIKRPYFGKKTYAKDQKSRPGFRLCQRDVRGSSTHYIYKGEVMSYIIRSVLLRPKTIDPICYHFFQLETGVRMYLKLKLKA